MLLVGPEPPVLRARSSEVVPTTVAGEARPSTNRRRWAVARTVAVAIIMASGGGGEVQASPGDPVDFSVSLTILPGGATGPTTVELRCPSGFSERQTGTSTFRFASVPPGVCTAVVTGATRARFRPVVAGEAYACRAEAQGLYCNSYQEQAVAPVPEPPMPGATVEPRAPVRGAGGVRVMLSRPDVALWGLITCPGGGRVKAEFDGSVATFADVPDEDCTLSLKGGSPVRFAGVRPGDEIICAPAGDTTRCQDSTPRATSPSVSAPIAVKPPPRRPRPPAEPVPDGDLEIRLADPTTSSWVYVQCPSGFRERGTFEAGEAVVHGLPSEACTLSFKGGTPARYSGVRGGQRLTCTLSGTLATCTP